MLQQWRQICQTAKANVMKKVLVLLILIFVMEFASAGICYIQVQGSVDCPSGGSVEYLQTLEAPCGIFNWKRKRMERELATQAADQALTLC